MIIKKYIKKINLKLRKRYFNIHYDISKPPTIICSDCLGGFIYHDAGLKFISPTINLTFDALDFISFCENINNLDNIIFEKKEDKKLSYPCAYIKFPNKKRVKVFFVHYDNFDYAVQCFNRRIKRMNQNICIILIVNELTKEIKERFIKLPYKKICYYLESSLLDNSNSVFIKIKNFKPKKDLLQFVYPISRKLNIDLNKIDYYSFVGFKKRN